MSVIQYIDIKTITYVLVDFLLTWGMQIKFTYISCNKNKLLKLFKNLAKPDKINYEKKISLNY